MIKLLADIANLALYTVIFIAVSILIAFLTIIMRFIEMVMRAFRRFSDLIKWIVDEEA